MVKFCYNCGHRVMETEVHMHEDHVVVDINK